MKKLLIFCLLVSIAPLCHAEYLSVEEILNLVYDDPNLALKASISGNASMDALTADDMTVLNNLVVYGTTSLDGSTSISGDTTLYGVVSLDNNLNVGGNYLTFTEITTPSNPPANDIRLYSKDRVGTTSLYTLDSAGAEVDILTAATGAPIDGTYIVQVPNVSLTNEQALSSLNMGLLFTNEDGIVEISSDINVNTVSVSRDATIYGILQSPLTSIISAETGYISRDVADLKIMDSIISAETGYISRDISIMKSMDSIISAETGYISRDIAMMKSLDSIISADIGYISRDISLMKIMDSIISSEVNIASRDIAIMKSLDSIISAETGYISRDVATMKLNIGILSTDVNAIPYIIMSRDIGIVSADVQDSGITKQPRIQFTITDPENLPSYSGRGDKSCIVYTNDSGSTLTISKVEAYCDEQNYKFVLAYGSLTKLNLSGQVSIDTFMTSTAGTNVYLTSDTGFTTATITNDNHILFIHDSGTAGNIHLNLYGNF